MEGIARITYWLPFPPSMNHYWRHVGPKVLISSKGRAYRELLCEKNRHLIDTLDGPLSLDITLYPPDRKRRDVDNFLKCLLDAMQHAGFYLDDSQIHSLRVVKREPDKLKFAAGAVAVRITKFEEVPE